MGRSRKDELRLYQEKVQRPARQAVRQRAAEAELRRKKRVAKRGHKNGGRKYARQVTEDKKSKLAAELLRQPSRRAAAEACGLSGHQAARLQQDPQVQQWIEESLEQTLAEADIEVKDVLRELARLARANMAHYTRRVGGQLVGDFSKTTYAQMAAIGEVTIEESFDDDKRHVRTKAKIHGKVQALDMLARYFKLFGDGSSAPGGGLPMGQVAPSLEVHFVTPEKKIEASSGGDD